MSQWDERFAQHPFSEALKSLAAAISSITIPDDAPAMESVERLKKVVAHVRAVASQCDPELVTPSMLERTTQSLNQVSPEIAAYASEPTQVRLDNANAQADALLDVIAGWPRPPVQELDGLGESLSSFRRSAGQLLRGVRDDEGTARQKLQELLDQGAQAATESSAQVASASAKLAELEARVETEKGRLDSVVSEFQSQFSAAQEKRSADFAEVREKLQTDSTVALGQQVAEVKKQSENLSERGKGLVAEITQLKADAVKAVGAIGNTGMTGGFQIYADAQRTTANKWSLVVIGPLLAIVGVAVWIIAETKTASDLNLRTFGAKFLISVPLAAVAGYAAQQSSRHRSNERHARKLELELASLDSFLAPLPVEQQQEIKKVVADRIFGRPDADVAIDKVGAPQLAELLAEALKALSKKL